jgi:hypothetical protein
MAARSQIEFSGRLLAPIAGIFGLSGQEEDNHYRDSHYHEDFLISKQNGRHSFFAPAAR